jgi:hypothetical protein
MPSHPRFPRSSVSGLIPTSVDPGSPAFNWADQKMYVGGPGGAPVLIGFPVRDFRTTRAYRLEDVVYYDGVLWRAKVDVVTAGAFNEAQWERLDGTGGQGGIELVGTVSLSPAQISDDGPSISISAGSGIILDKSNPDNPRATAVSWPARTLTKASLPKDNVLYVGINTSGTAAIFTIDEITPQWRSENILVGHFVVGSSTGALIDPVSRHFPGNTTRGDLIDFLEVVGSFRVSGVELQLTGTNQLGITSGMVWSHHGALSAAENLHSIAAAAPLPVRTTLRGSIVGESAITVINPAIYDVAGVSIAVPAGQFTIQYVFLKPGGGVIACLGQALYPSLAVAVSSLRSDADSFEFASTIAPEYVLLGAVVSNDDGSEQSVIPSRLGIAGSKIGGTGGALSTGEFLNRDGSLPMTGDLDLGGNSLVNGVVDGDQVAIRPVTLATTGALGAAGADLSVNLTDKRVMVGNMTVASQIGPHDPARVYLEGDLVIQGAGLYRCTQEQIAPGPFNPNFWFLIGSPATNALTKLPASETDNQIDLTGVGGFARALSIDFDDGQTTDIVNFGPRAGIDRYGLPNGAFNADIEVRTQVGHGFTLIGTPIRMLSDGNWVLADQTNKPTAVVHEVINANVFVVQYSGVIRNLPPSVIEGGSAPVRNTTYYASATPGILSPSENSSPVMQALSSTSGILRLQLATVAQLSLRDIYPVGALYLTLDPTLPPAFLVGMQWQQVAQGDALIGAGNNGEYTYDGGEERGSEIPTGPKILIGQNVPEFTEIAEGDIVITYDPEDTVSDGNAPTEFEHIGRTVENVVQPGFAIFVFRRIA